MLGYRGMSPKITAPALAKTYGGHWRWRTHSFAGLVVKLSTGRRAGADTDGHKGTVCHLPQLKACIISTSPKIFALSIVIRL
jgi:hypothetical protein